MPKKTRTKKTKTPKLISTEPGEITQTEYFEKPIDMVGQAAGRLQAVLILLDGLRDYDAYDAERDGGWTRGAMRDLIEGIQADCLKSYSHAVAERER